jgi:hypothetical protein
MGTSSKVPGDGRRRDVGRGAAAGRRASAAGVMGSTGGARTRRACAESAEEAQSAWGMRSAAAKPSQRRWRGS